MYMWNRIYKLQLCINKIISVKFGHDESLQITNRVTNQVTCFEILYQFTILQVTPMFLPDIIKYSIKQTAFKQILTQITLGNSPKKLCGSDF